MAILKPEEYDTSYFDGDLVENPHPAGYSKYGRWFRYDGENSLGEYWKDYANKLLTSQAIQGKKVLELGCAYGFIVEDLRNMGVDAYGIDFSKYALGKASPEVKPYLIEGDIRTILSGYKNKEFDLVFGITILQCLKDTEITPLMTEVKRIGKKAYFIEAETSNPNYYNLKSTDTWNLLSLPGITITNK
jgi:ubiquinone/menaquinone biosynthesis C-methylase UbiE